jgi:hypothetical protein
MADHAQYHAELVTVAAGLGVDEVRTLLYLARRLEMGARQYGTLDIAHDRRDWDDEARAETADLAVYATLALLCRRRAP